MNGVRYMGDNLALLTPREGECMEDLIKLNKEWFESVFDNIEPWSKSHVAGHKIVWVRCYSDITLEQGLFSKVVGEVATLVSIGKSTMLWENLEYARLQVCLLKSCNARLAKDMQINDQMYSIYIEEEYPIKNGGQCKCTYNYFASSDSVSSLETYVEETIFYEKSCEEEVRHWDGENKSQHIYCLNC